jgi:hypothetical protein
MAGGRRVAIGVVAVKTAGGPPLITLENARVQQK